CEARRRSCAGLYRAAAAHRARSCVIDPRCALARSSARCLLEDAPMKVHALFFVCVSLAACTANLDSDIGSDQEAAAGPATGGHRWPDLHVRYYLDPSITTAYTASDACASTGDVAPCGRSTAERIQHVGERYEAVTRLQFDPQVGTPNL